MIIIFALTASLVAAILDGLHVASQRLRTPARPRGASQGLIIALLLTQMAALSVVDAVAGSAAAIGLAATGDPLPGWEFFTAVAILAIVTGLIAALAPALAAARRDPLKELRVP